MTRARLSRPMECGSEFAVKALDPVPPGIASQGADALAALQQDRNKRIVRGQGTALSQNLQRLIDPARTVEPQCLTDLVGGPRLLLAKIRRVGSEHLEQPYRSIAPDDRDQIE